MSRRRVAAIAAPVVGAATVLPAIGTIVGAPSSAVAPENVRAGVAELITTGLGHRDWHEPATTT